MRLNELLELDHIFQAVYRKRETELRRPLIYLLYRNHKRDAHMDLRQTFATNLRRLRHAKGWSQDELALEAEMSRSYLSQIEKGKFYVSLKVVGRLAEALHVDPVEFLRPPCDR